MFTVEPLRRRMTEIGAPGLAVRLPARQTVAKD
jgi:hypothetical protein